MIIIPSDVSETHESINLNDSCSQNIHDIHYPIGYELDWNAIFHSCFCCSIANYLPFSHFISSK